MVHRWSAFAGVIAVATAASTLTTSEAHSWIDCIDKDRAIVYDNARDWIYGGETSRGKCHGYVNNYPGRGDPKINDKMTYKILMEDVAKGAPPCPAYSNDNANSGGFPRIRVNATDKFYYGYLDNGHTSKDKAGRGTFYGVYWTGEPDTKLDSTTQLIGDKLIDGTLHDFDDKNCGQTYEDGDFSGSILSGRAGNDFPCVGDLAMPKGTKPGVYNLIWFWRFYNEKVNADVKTTGGHYGGAAYSSCFQVEVVDESGGMQSEATSAPTPTPTPTPSASPALMAEKPPTTNDDQLMTTAAEATDAPTPVPSTVAPATEKPSPTPAATPAPVATMVGIPQHHQQDQQGHKKDCGVRNDKHHGAYLRS